MTRFWGFRTDTSVPRKYYNDQLESRCVLRQGWGWHERQNLREVVKQADTPREQRTNIRMYRDVRKGDFILVPRLPEWGLVTVAQAVEDWKTGYRFEVDEVKIDDDGTHRTDYGHQFPAEYLTCFNRNNKHVSGDLRQTLKCRSRFWNMDRYSESILKIIGKNKNELIGFKSLENRFRESVGRVVQEAKLADLLHKALSEEFAGSGWEYALVAGLEDLFPYYQVERTGGRNEKQHGTDILITMPGPLGVKYGIAIQVKDWKREPKNIEEAIAQIRKADDFWREERGLRIVEKIVILTEADYTEGPYDDVAVVDRHELKKLLGRMASSTAVAIDEDA